MLLDKTKVCIPASWLQNINIVDCFNNLFKRNEKKVVFFSFDESKAPDFSLPIFDKFDCENNACYQAFVLKAFDSKEKCIEYLNKRRAIEPVYYCRITTSNSTINDLRDEIARQMAIDQKSLVKKVVNALRKVILHNRDTPSIDLTDSDIEDFQHGLDEPISIEDEYSMLQEENNREIPFEDILSGNIPFQESSVRKLKVFFFW